MNKKNSKVLMRAGLTVVVLILSQVLLAGCRTASRNLEWVETEGEALPHDTEYSGKEQTAEFETVTEFENLTESEAAKEPNPDELLLFYEKAEACTVVKEEDLDYMDFEQLFTIEEISDQLFDRIYGKSWKEDCTLAREELRYLRLLHRGFDGETHVGEMICSRLLAEDLLEIFKELYRQGYPIEKILLIDEFNADDELSMAANNTSCFNFRKVSGSSQLSKHASGRAVDINPLYNPYVRTRDGVTICEPHNAAEYTDRSRDFPYKIDKDDLCYQLFTERGFEWGGVWNSSKDYQHFQK